ncbi:hypothetical protein F444_03770 [Phytophthora nicotianae P1976]|uniref:Uncharacterized protein n=1 Tax=Phytophthora nicotianae P1976 TaxID=1317066 RepID=A0A081ASZ3_PHYNI|nr:hypothetical protein F444_03770 [Phytophthora nicotianae P1976]
MEAAKTIVAFNLVEEKADQAARIDQLELHGGVGAHPACSDRPFSRASDCFERGLMNAITDQFPLVKIDGWLFHWTQALWRKMIEQQNPLN